MKIPFKYTLSEIIAAIFILLFCYTGVSKLIDRHSFRNVIEKSPLIGKAAGLLSWILPATELIVVAFLLIPYFREMGLLIASCLMALFTGYIAYMLMFAAKLPCSCGGVLKTLSWPQHLVFNILFTILAATGWTHERKHKKILQ